MQEAVAVAKKAQQEAALQFEAAQQQEAVARQDAAGAKCTSGLVWSESGAAPCTACKACGAAQEVISACTATADTVCSKLSSVTIGTKDKEVTLSADPKNNLSEQGVDENSAAARLSSAMLALPIAAVAAAIWIALL